MEKKKSNSLEIIKQLFLKQIIKDITKKCRSFENKEKCTEIIFCTQCTKKIKKVYKFRFDNLKKCKYCNRTYNQNLKNINDHGFRWSNSYCDICYFLKDLK